MAKVLIVEDNFLVAYQTAQFVEAFGHEVIGPCHTLESGLEALDTKEIDAAVLDFELGDDTTSKEIIERLQESKTPFFVLTGCDKQKVSSLVGKVPLRFKPISDACMEKSLATIAPREKSQYAGSSGKLN